MALLQIAEPGQSSAPHEHRIAIGIDLGTTHSLVATVLSGKAKVLHDDKVACYCRLSSIMQRKIHIMAMQLRHLSLQTLKTRLFQSSVLWVALKRTSSFNIHTLW